MGGTGAWSLLPLLPLAFYSFYSMGIKRKNMALGGTLICAVAMFPLSYLSISIFGYERVESPPLIPSWIFELVLVAVFAFLIVSFILPYIGAAEKARKIRLAILAILFTVMILDNPLDLPYIICVILVNSLYAVAVIRGPEPLVRVSK